jgi:HK97 family phage portal protein
VSQSRTIADRIAEGWRWIIRRLQVVEEPEQIRYGHAWSQEAGVQQPYPAVNSMSAFGKFPWIYAAVEAVATDIAGLPLQVRRLVGDRNRAVQRHPFLRLMERPTSQTGPTLWRRQMIVDLLLTGNYFALILGRGSSVTSLVRLHPEHVQIIPSSSGGVAAYRYTEEGVSTDYSPDDVVHVRQTSYRDGPQSLYGQGVIEVLETELTGEYAASQRWRDEAGRGQPTMTISPKDGASIRPDVLEKLVASIQRHANRTGIVPIGGPVDITQLPFNARDMEFSAARDWTRASILAVVGVAYVRLFLPSANFATAKQQNRIYWQNLLGLIALVEDALSVVAVRMGRVSDRVAHDTSNVEALQESRTDRLNRAAILVDTFGLDPIAALQVEGFTEIDDTMLPQAGQPDGAAEAVALEPVASAEDQLLSAQRAEILVASGVLSPNEARDELGYTPLPDGDQIRRGLRLVKSLSDLSEEVQEGLRNKAEEHNEKIESEGMADWRKTTAGTLALVFQREQSRRAQREDRVRRDGRLAEDDGGDAGAGLPARGRRLQHKPRKRPSWRHVCGSVGLCPGQQLPVCPPQRPLSQREARYRPAPGRTPPEHPGRRAQHKGAALRRPVSDGRR